MDREALIVSNYNADPNPDIDRIRQVAFGYRFAPLAKLKIDQFSTASTLKVYTCVQLLGSTRLQILVDPSDIPA